MDLSQIINTIKKRPGMYLGSNSITALLHFLNGYQAAMRDLGKKQSDSLFPLSFWYMHEFINVYLKCNNNMGWCSNILGFCGGDEQKALDKFFDLYYEFSHIGMNRYWKAVLTEDNIKYNNSMEHSYVLKPDGKEPVFKNPYAAYVIELTIPAFLFVVETKENVVPWHQFFTSAADAKGNGHFTSGAGVYFGGINSWEEIISDNINFGKIIEW